MKTLGRLLVLCIVALAAVITYPTWHGPLVHAVPALNQYLPTPSQTPGPSPSPTMNDAPITINTPLFTPVGTGAPGPVPSTMSVPWSRAECAWALSTMQLDEHLDQQEAWAIAEGFDPRFPNLSFEQVYVTWEQDWAMVVGQLQDMCTTGVSISADRVAAAEQDFASAIASHQADTVKNPGDAAWNTTWIANYQRLAALYEELP